MLDSAAVCTRHTPGRDESRGRWGRRRVVGECAEITRRDQTRQRWPPLSVVHPFSCPPQSSLQRFCRCRVRSCSEITDASDMARRLLRVERMGLPRRVHSWTGLDVAPQPSGCASNQYGNIKQKRLATRLGRCSQVQYVHALERTSTLDSTSGRASLPPPNAVTLQSWTPTPMRRWPSPATRPAAA